MIENGLIEEVKTLLDQGYSPDLPTLTAIGYREIIAFLDNKIDLPTAVMEMRRKTRIFIRRQANWFKADDPNINWFRANHEISEEIVKFIFEWLQEVYKYENEQISPE
jgi:tRNA dimethylallyltransferase